MDLPPHDASLSVRLGSVLRAYYPLGFIAFGGPSVHVVLLRKRFVDTFHWIDDKTFVDLFSLSNGLPGPGSTQLAFSIAVVTHGVLPGLFAFFIWALPGAFGMAGLGLGVGKIPNELPPVILALLSGMNSAAVGLIALAALLLTSNAGTDQVTKILIWLSASFGVCYHAPWMYPTLIATGGLVTLVWDRRRLILARLRQRRETPLDAILMNDQVTGDRPVDTPVDTLPSGLSQRTTTPRGPSLDTRIIESTPQSIQSNEIGDSNVQRNEPDNALEPVQVDSALRMKVLAPLACAALFSGFVLLLAVSLGTRGGLQNASKAVPRPLNFFCNMLIAGTIIFGGGPVVIPVLRDYVVSQGWVSSRDFLLVFSILQAFPGPNFNFAVALGVLAVSSDPALGAVLGFIGIFAPGIVLKLAVLPFYASWRDKAIVRSIIRGLNASASGLVWTAVWRLFLVGYIYQPATGASSQSPSASQLSGPLTQDPFWIVVSSGAFVASRILGAPPWLSIIGGAVAGIAWYGVQQE